MRIDGTFTDKFSRTYYYWVDDKYLKPNLRLVAQPFGYIIPIEKSINGFTISWESFDGAWQRYLSIDGYVEHLERFVSRLNKMVVFI